MDFKEKQETELIGRLVLANKIDLNKARVVQEEEGYRFA
jgi:hypothetical protein